MTAFIYSPAKGRRSGSTMQKRHSRSAAVRMLAARDVRQGYPVTRKFQSRKEVEDYLAGEVICCLLCGKEYKQLGPHIARIHGIDTWHYLRLYDIPASYTLEGSETRRLRKETSTFAADPQKYAFHKGKKRVFREVPRVYAAFLIEEIAQRRSSKGQFQKKPQ